MFTLGRPDSLEMLGGFLALRHFFCRSPGLFNPTDAANKFSEHEKLFGRQVLGIDASFRRFLRLIHGKTFPCESVPTFVNRPGISSLTSSDNDHGKACLTVRVAGRIGRL